MTDRASDRPIGLPIYAGAMHYWRVEPAAWPACLRALRDLGFTLVDTLVPWREHEPARGEHDWRGARDLSRFLVAARAAGLGVVLRPGPSCGGDLAGFGVPDWVLAEPACQALTSRGTPAWLPFSPRAFPIPSYASAPFQAHVRAWFAAVAAVVQPHLPPDGPIVAIALGGADPHALRGGAFDLDYHPAALAWWAEDAGDLAPPRAWDAARAGDCARWVRFGERYLARAHADFARMLDDIGLGGVARIAGTPVVNVARAKLPSLRRRRGEAIEIAGFGVSPWLPPLDAPGERDGERERDQLLTLLAGGARGFSLSMAVERDRHLGAAIDRTGRIEPHAAWLKPLLAALADVDWPSLRRAAPIAVIAPRADDAFALASGPLAPISPAVTGALGLELGGEPDAALARRWFTAVCSALELAQVAYAIVDGAADLAAYRAVIAPTLHRIEQRTWDALCARAEPRRVVVIGPHTPTRDEFDRPLTGALRRAGHLQPESLDDLAGLAADLAALAGDDHESSTWRVDAPAGVHTAVFCDDAGTARVVFAISDAPESRSVALVADAATRFVRDLLTGEVFPVRGRRVTVAVRGIRMLGPVAAP